MNTCFPTPAVPAEYDHIAMQAHCRRVGAAAVELADRLQFSKDKQTALSEASAVHHRFATSPDSRFLNRLILEVWGFEHDGGEEDKSAASMEMAQLLELCCLFVQRWEYSPYELAVFRDIVGEFEGMARDGFFEKRHVEGLAVVPSVDRGQVERVVSSLPVFPTVALTAMQLAVSPEASAIQLEKLIGTDPVLAGEILRAANSSLFSPLTPIRTIRQAVLFMGLPEACRVLSAAALRPIFHSPLLRPLWKHSLEVARLSEALAKAGGKADPEEAFLTGLIHDVGRLALWKLPANVSSKYKHLLEQGCEPLFAEVLLCGFDHAAAGADVARHWRLAPAVIEAIENHHQPERTTSPLASLLFLAEYWTGANEDLPSLSRLNIALGHTALTRSDLDRIEAKPPLEW
jgi:putative nucleotidyltransferase with HDIG domain